MDSYRERPDEHDKAMALVEEGESKLLDKRAEARLNAVTSAVAFSKIELTSRELSHLHIQLQSITTQCTLIIGFALASIGVDTLQQLASDTESFCIYKSWRTRILGSMYLLLTTLSICLSMTIISCSQVIIYKSTRASFEYRDIRSVVEMTLRLMDGRGMPEHQPHKTNARFGRSLAHRPINENRRSNENLRLSEVSAVTPESPKCLGCRYCIQKLFTFNGAGLRKFINHISKVNIYFMFVLLLVAFFSCTVLVVWLFLGTNDWIKAGKGIPLHVRQPPNETVWNDYLIFTDAGEVYKRCLNPYNEQDMQVQLRVGFVVSSLNTFLFCCALLVGYLQVRFVQQHYTMESLAALETALPRA